MLGNDPPKHEPRPLRRQHAVRDEERKCEGVSDDPVARFVSLSSRVSE